MHIRRLWPTTVVLLLTIGLTVGLGETEPTAQAAAPAAATAVERPNVVLITADDMRADDLAFMPRTRKLLGQAGITFTDALSNYPLCCPARATLVTGQYSHNNGVQGNEYPFGGHRKFYESGREKETLAVWLKRAGYNTAFVGKYLNYYGSSHPVQGSTGPRYVPPGWDDWHASIGRVFRYYCPTLNENGAIRRKAGRYQTDLYTDLSEKLIGRYAARSRPFFLWTSHLAPHRGQTPSPDDWCQSIAGMPVPAAERHEEMFPGIPLPESPAVNEADMSDKGTYMQGRQERDLAQTALVHQGRLQALQSLDESVADIVRALRRQGVLKRTLIVFTSDNGWLLGEHRLEKKIYPYEESIKVPLLLRGPGLPQGALRHQPVGLVDITATVVAASGAAATVPQDGTSLLPMAVDGNILERRVLPIESGPAPAVQERHNAQLPDWFYRGIRSSRYAYIAWQFTDQVEEELYDLDEDPYQLESRHRQPSTELATARTYREQLQGCAGPQCIQELPPTMEDGEPRPAPPGDATAPKVTVERAPRGWIRNARPKVRYAVTDATDPNRDLAHWCSHQAPDCDGEATLRLRGEGAHSWTVLATDPAGNVGSAWGRLSLDLFRPTVRRKGPPRKALESGRARLSWRVRDSASGVVDVDTRRRTAGLRGGFTAWAYPARLQDRRSPLRAVRLPAANGTVCLQVRARDKVGRRSGWRGQVCRARAIDAARLTTGADWRTVERPRWYGGTGTVSSTRGSRLAVPNRGGVGLVRVVARTGPGMGKLRIDVGSRTVARIDLDRPRRGLREFNVRGGRGRVTATVVSAGRPVWVDSVGVVRRP